MKIRFKFRGNFFVHELSNRDKELLDLLKVASHKFNIDLHNVQLSLNANDYFGMEECSSSLSALGIVTGDILYVNSLEKLDDIRRSMDSELFSLLTTCFCDTSLPNHTIVSMFSVPVHLCALQKGLTPTNHIYYSEDIVRSWYNYAGQLNSRLTLTLFLTGNLVSFAGSSESFGIRRQVILPIRDYLTTRVLMDSDVSTNPAGVFKKTANLIIRLKDELLEPILIDMHTALKLPERPSLLTLPYEIQTRILLFLPLNSLGNLLLTCSHMVFCIQQCSPLWRYQLGRIEAKKRPVLVAALNRQQQQQQQQATSTPTASAVGPGALPATTTVHSSASDFQPESIDTLLGPQPNSTDRRKPYQDFLARYRSLTAQRWRRSFSPSYL